MEIHSENSKDTAQFFSLFNALVAKVSKTKGKMFNPKTFMCNEGGANHKEIRMIYGEDFATLIDQEKWGANGISKMMPPGLPNA